MIFSDSGRGTDRQGAPPRLAMVPSRPSSHAARKNSAPSACTSSEKRIASPARDDRFEQLPAFGKRHHSEVLAVQETDLGGILQAWTPADGALQQLEVGAALVVEHDRLAIEDHGCVAELARLGDDRAELLVQS